MTDEERARKANARRVRFAIIEVSKAISELGVAEVETLVCEDPLSEPMLERLGAVISKLNSALCTLGEVRESLEGEAWQTN